MKAFRYRLYPTKEQETILRDTLFLCNRVYNECLAERKSAWEERKESIKPGDQVKKVQGWQDVAPWSERFPNAPPLSSIYAQVRNEPVARLDKAFQAFFRRVKKGEKPGYPKFQSARYYDSFTYTQGGFKILLEDRTQLSNGSVARGDESLTKRYQQLSLAKIGILKIRMHRPISGKIKTCTIRRTASGWYVCFSCEIQEKPLPRSDAKVGIDVGIEHFVTTSDGKHFGNLKPYKKSLDAMRRAQRRVSRRRKGSKSEPSSRRRRKAIRLLARLHEHVANQRKDVAHKVAEELLKMYGTVGVEDLEIGNMLKNHYLAQSISDAGWGQFLTVLQSKAQDAGRLVVKVNARGTSQECSGCGSVVHKDLSVRVHNCPECGLVIQRDVNAARNILKRTLRELEAMSDQSGGSRRTECSE
jgi:putative transposase